MEKTRQEVESLRTLQNNLLETLRQSVIVVDIDGVITHGNAAALDVWGITNRENLPGQKIQNTILSERCRELNDYFSRPQLAGADPVQFQAKLRLNSNEEDRILAITLKAIVDEGHNRTGTLIYAEDVSTQEKLRTTIEELESTAEELHSANEELETTNEELQSTNEELETTNEELQSTVEELETTNEELQSTNEELETTNEELQSTNEELETMNEELQSTNDELQEINDAMRARTEELNTTNAFLASVLQSLGTAVMVVDEELRITVWSSGAEELWGLRAHEAQGRHLLALDIGLPVNDVAPLVQRILQEQSPDKLSTEIEAINRRGRRVRLRIDSSVLLEDGVISGVILVANFTDALLTG
jgi:two-component system CheB/CheR fusion protein